MPWPLKRNLIVSPKQQQVLDDVINSRTSRQDHRLRAQIILSWVKGKSENKIALMLHVNRTMVSHWKRRWFDNEEKLTAYDDCLSGIEYSRAVLSLLNDAPRSGAPGKFSAEQICQIINVSCESPEDSNLPLSHWSLKDLASELIRRGIVESISTSQLSVFLKSSRN